MKKFTYPILIAVLIISFFLLTGGINEPVELPQPPYITDLSVTGFSQVYDPGAIILNGTPEEMKWKGSDGCSRTSAMSTNLQILKENVIVYNGEFTTVNDERYEYIIPFMVPGTYKAIATQTGLKDDGGQFGTDTKTVDFTVNTSPVFMEAGVYRITEFKAICSGTTYTVTGTDLNNSNFEVTAFPTYYAARLNLNVTFNNTPVPPCVDADQYTNISETGTLRIEKSGSSNYLLKILRQGDVEVGAQFGYTKSGNTVTLSYSKGNSNYTLKLEKQ